MDERRKERKGRPVAWIVTLAAIVLLTLALFAWNRHEAGDVEDAAPGPTVGALAEETGDAAIV